MASVRPFQISVSDRAIDQLHKKLELTNIPDGIEDAEWEYGVSLLVEPRTVCLQNHRLTEPSPDIKRLTSYWKDGFDWKEQQAKLNELPHFKTKIEVDGFQEIDMHFVHQRSDVEGAIPLLFVHGCLFSLPLST